MADRYWVGGTGAWSAANTANWSATSGGSGGASVPTSADTPQFDANSGTGVVTFTNGGVTVGATTIAKAGLTLSLGAAFTTSGTITLTEGTFTTNNFNVTATTLTSNNSNTRTINLGSSTVTLSGPSLSWNTSSSTNLNLNAGTSTIVLTSASSGLYHGGNDGLAGTFYNLSFTSSAITAASIEGSLTFNNVTIAGRVTAGVSVVVIQSGALGGGNKTINGTLTFSAGANAACRTFVRSDTIGITRTLTCAAVASLTDIDFRDITIAGAAAPVSGTRIGDLRGIRGITASTPKTVYWNLAAGGNWSANAWAASSGGAVSTDNFPLAQDTAVIENTGLNTSATVTMDGLVPYVGTVTMATRTSAMTFSMAATFSVYGSWSNGSGTALSGGATVTFSGRNTQIVTCAGKAFTAGLVLDSYGGVLELADAANFGIGGSFTINNGTFDTKNYNFTTGGFSSNNSGVRAINLGSSTITITQAFAFDFANTTNLTFNAGTSQINITASSNITMNGGSGVKFYNVAFTNTTAATHAVLGVNTFNNFTLTAPASAGLTQCTFNANQTITGTLTCAGATAVRRIFLRSNTIGTTRTLTVNSMSATDCDFRDITIAGAAAGSSPTRAGNCGGNNNITFPSPKTVYWNLAGTQSWNATGWCPSSGGTPDINQFPLAQDTAVFDNTGAAGTVTVDRAWNIGTLNMSGRTSACTIDWSNGSPNYHGNVLLGPGVTPGTTGVATMAGRGTQTITSSGKTWSGAITIDCVTGTVQLADALTLIAARTLTLTSGTFDAVTYNVTTGLFAHSGATATLKMGSGTWTLSGTGTIWNSAGVGALTFLKGTANIVLSDTSTTARTFNGGGFSYNKLTIGGVTGTSTLTIGNDNQFTELASTKTVAHTIALGVTTQTFGAWTVTGTAGNVVTVTGTGTLHVIAGDRVSGVDYLAMGTIGFSIASLGEFYAGVNSTGSNATIIKTAAPTPVTRYWRGGTGTWDATTTTNWSASSGGAGGASVPTSADAVVFDSLSNATAYTVTCTATQLRCASLTMAGPLTGNVTWAGSALFAMHGNVSLAATGITRTYSGGITLSGSSTGRTFTTNGVALASTITVNGVGCGWTLGSALSSTGTTFTVTNGSFDSGSYNIAVLNIFSPNANTRSITFGSGTITLIGSNSVNFGNSNATAANLTFNAGTSTISCLGSSPYIISFLPVAFYNVSFDSTSLISAGIANPGTFNNITVAGRTSAGIGVVAVDTFNVTVLGTLTILAGTDATMRTFVRSVTIGATRTLTCAAVAALTDVDFRDIIIAGAAAPVSGTRLGDCKGNSGITFGAGVTRYWNLAGGGNWSGTGWAATSGGAPAANNFPLAQDTALFEATGLNSGATLTVDAAFNIGTISMSARTSNTMTLATGSTTPTIYGNWITGTGTTLTGTGMMTFAGRGSQTITSAGRTFTQPITVNSPGGSVTLQDAYNSSPSSTAIILTAGTLDANGYNVTIAGASSGMQSSGSITRTIAFGSGTWTLAGASTPFTATSTNLTVTGTGTISLTSASAKTFAGGDISYPGLTLNQGGSGALTITGNNTFKSITNTYSATGATSINIGTTTQTLTQPWTATGAAGRVLTVQGASATSPGTLVFTGSGLGANVDYLAITGVRAYSLVNTWYAGSNSTNNGSLGWIFGPGTIVVTSTGNMFLMFI